MTGIELKTLRKALGMTQAELATKLRISQGYLGELEREEKAIEPRTAMAVGYIDEASAKLTRTQSIFSDIVPEARCELWDYQFRIRCGTVLDSGQKVEVSFLRSVVNDEVHVADQARLLKSKISIASGQLV